MKTLILISLFLSTSSEKPKEICVIPETGRFEIEEGLGYFVIDGCKGNQHRWKLKKGLET